MAITLLLEHDLEGQTPFLEAGWRETGWDQYLPLEAWVRPWQGFLHLQMYGR
jgi:hypothetical protein